MTEAQASRLQLFKYSGCDVDLHDFLSLQITKLTVTPRCPSGKHYERFVFAGVCLDYRLVASAIVPEATASYYRL